MGSWSKYEKLGLWGLWCEHFGTQHPFFVVVSFDEVRWSFAGVSAPPALTQKINQEPVFFWQAQAGLVVEVYSSAPVDVHAAEYWRALLHYESQRVSGRHSFFPAFFPVSDLSKTLNGLLLGSPHVLLANGQPGVGKRSLLESMLLLHAGIRLPSERLAVVDLMVDDRRAVVVPEVALLEPEEQLALVHSARKGDLLWVATVYDLAMLKSRKIVSPALTDLLEPAKVLLPAVANRDAAELKSFAAFWAALYGVEAGATPANLAFLKQKTVGQVGLSVEAILEEGRGLRGVIAEFEKEAMLKAQARVGRSQHKIARMLKVSRGSLQHKLRKYQLESFESADADTEETE